jgi:hypothetical protein
MRNKHTLSKVIDKISEESNPQDITNPMKGKADVEITA